MSINDASRLSNFLVVNVRCPGGANDVFIEPVDVSRFLSDPDAFAAAHFGLSKVQYIEWVTLDGAALCGARTAGGDLCRNLISHIQLNPKDWMLRHRHGHCKTHGRIKPK